MSTVRYLRLLLGPHEAFDGWALGGFVVLGVLVVVCVLNAASMAYAADAVVDEVDGTVTVDSPTRAPDWMCEGSSGVPDGGCSGPETIQEPLRPAASDTADRVTLKAAFTPLAFVPFVAALLVVAAGKAGGDDDEVIHAFGDGVGSPRSPRSPASSDTWLGRS